MHLVILLVRMARSLSVKMSTGSEEVAQRYVGSLSLADADAVDIQVDDGLSVGIHKRCHLHVLKTPRSRDMMASVPR